MNECKKEKRGGICFYNCDNIEFMKTKPDNYYDLAIVDPPYGIGADKEKFTPINKTWIGKKKVGYLKKDWDKEIPTPEYFEQLFRVSKKQIVWGGNYFGLIGGYLFWDKLETMPTYTKGELAWCSFMNKIDKFEFLWSGYKKQVNETRIHPTQKPTNLYRFCLLNYAEKGNKILDTHGGSMSIAKACDMEGFDLDVIEIDEQYFNDGLDAFDEYKRQFKLF
jgi:site-specific DNA-methyltransferase (adenine-specific)